MVLAVLDHEAYASDGPTMQVFERGEKWGKSPFIEMRLNYKKFV